MLGRKTYTQDEVDRARSVVEDQLAAYRDLVQAAGTATGRPDAAAVREAFERCFFTNLTVLLDRFFVHRIRPVTGKDGNPLNEVELIVESVIEHGGVMRGNKVIKYVPADSVLGLEDGAPIRLTADDFDRLSTAFLAELERRFVLADG